jgi:hypothetical protein
MSGAAGNLRPSGQRGRQKAEMFAGHSVAVDATVSGGTVVGAGAPVKASAIMFDKVPVDFATAGEVPWSVT